MSLLLDALKKTGQGQHQGAPREELVGSITGQTRAAGQNLFAVKISPTPSMMELAIAPLLIIGVLFLVGGGGYYAWQASSSEFHAELPESVVAADPEISTIQNKPAPVIAVAENNIPQPKVVVVEQQNLPPLTKPGQKSVAEKKPVHIERNKNPDGIHPTLLSAYQAYRSGDFAEAWQLYRKVLQQDGKNRDALLGMAAIAQHEGQNVIATRYYSQLLTLDPRDPDAHAGVSELPTSDPASMESRLKLQLAHRPDSAVLNFALGNLYAGLSRWSEAEKAYFNAYKRQQNEPLYAFNLAISLDHLGQDKNAATYYQRALQLDQSTASGFNSTRNFNHEQVQQRANDLMAR